MINLEEELKNADLARIKSETERNIAETKQIKKKSGSSFL
jgi:hypothetical protein